MLTITPQVVSISGTANEIAADVPNGVVTLSTPQAIGTGSSPTFAGLTLSGLTLGSIPFAGTGGIISQDNGSLFWDAPNKRIGFGTTAPFCTLANRNLDTQDAATRGVATSGLLWSVSTGASGKYAAAIENRNSTFSDSSGLLVRTSLGNSTNLIFRCDGGGVDVFSVFGDGTAFLTGPLTLATHIGGTGTTSPLTLRSTSGVGAAGADIIFQVGNNGATEAMRILNNGAVGIGVSPGAKLDVNGAVRVQGAIGANAASVGVFDFSAGAARILSWGANTTTKGNFVVQSLSSDASLSTEVLRVQGGYVYQNGQTAFGMYQVDMTGVVNNGSLALKGTYPVGFFMCSVYNGDGINRTLLASTRSGACSIVSDPSGTWEVNTTTPAAGHQSIVLDAATGILTFYNKSGATTSPSGAVLFIQ